MENTFDSDSFAELLIATQKEHAVVLTNQEQN